MPIKSRGLVLGLGDWGVFTIGEDIFIGRGTASDLLESATSSSTCGIPTTLDEENSTASMCTTGMGVFQHRGR